jgi:O-antigen ligase
MANRQNRGNRPNNPKNSNQLAGSKKPEIKSPRIKSVGASTGFDKGAMRWLIWGSVTVSLAIWFSLNDPFNAPKSWVLSIGAFWLLGWLIFRFKYFIQNRTLRVATVFSGAFAIALLAAFLATDNKFTGMFGETLLKTGFLSYFSLTVFFLSAAYLIRLHRFVIFERAVVFVGIVSGTYGFLQHYKIDFTKNTYAFSPLVGTLGNPDFVGASLAILLVLNVGIAIASKHKLWFRTVAGFNVLLLPVVILFSQARQGLLAAGVGLGVILLVWIYQRYKKAAYTLGGFALITGLGVVAGMLKIGPLAGLIYKPSVTYRGDFWRAAARMFTHHPLFGVGLDRFSAYFRQYRDTTQSLRFGPDQIANVAHNVPLQLAATGGVFVLAAYLLLMGFIFWRGIVALRMTKGPQQLLIAVVFGAWLTYQSQSIISIDNLGIAIWGYLIGGALVGLSVSTESDGAKAPSISMAQPIVSGILASVLLVVSLLFYGSESSMHYLKLVVPPADPKLLTQYELIANKPLTYLFKDPEFEYTSAVAIAHVHGISPAIESLKAMIANDPRGFDAMFALAQLYANQQKNWAGAIALDKAMIKLDPYNQLLLLQLGRHEKSAGNLTAARAVIPLISAFAPNSAEAKLALTEFGK